MHIVLCLILLIPAISLCRLDLDDLNTYNAVQIKAQVEYVVNDHAVFVNTVRQYFKDVPQPGAPTQHFIRDNNKFVYSCINEAPDIAESPHPGVLIRDINKSMKGNKCARRVIGDWYYEVCGSRTVSRYRYRIGALDRKTGRLKVHRLDEAQLLGYLGSKRTLSRHPASVLDPRYVEQEYLPGEVCYEEDATNRNFQTSATFECSDRFVPGYVHILNVTFDHGCQLRLRLQSADFCSLQWLGNPKAEAKHITCYIYFDQARIARLKRILDIAEKAIETQIRFIRHWNTKDIGDYIDEDGNAGEVLKEMNKHRQRVIDRFKGKAGDEIGVNYIVERARIKLIASVIVRELGLIFRSSPHRPFSVNEEEQARELDAEGEKARDEHRVDTLKELDEMRSKHVGFLEEDLKWIRDKSDEGKEQREELLAKIEQWKILGYSELLKLRKKGYDPFFADEDEVHLIAHDEDEYLNGIRENRYEIPPEYANSYVLEMAKKFVVFHDPEKAKLQAVADKLVLDPSVTVKYIEFPLDQDAWDDLIEELQDDDLKEVLNRLRIITAKKSLADMMQRVGDIEAFVNNPENWEDIDDIQLRVMENFDDLEDAMDGAVHDEVDDLDEDIEDIDRWT